VLGIPSIFSFSTYLQFVRTLQGLPVYGALRPCCNHMRWPIYWLSKRLEVETQVPEGWVCYPRTRRIRIRFNIMYITRVLRRLHFFPSPNTQFVVITLMDPVCFFPPPQSAPTRYVCLLILCTVSTSYNGSRKYILYLPIQTYENNII